MPDEDTTQTIESTVDAPKSNVPMDPAFADQDLDGYLPPVKDEEMAAEETADPAKILENWHKGRDNDIVDESDEDKDSSAEKDKEPEGDEDTEEVDLGFDDALLREARSEGLTAEAAREYETGDELRQALANHRATKSRRSVETIPTVVTETPVRETTTTKGFELKLKEAFEAKEEDGSYKYESEIRDMAASVERMNEHRNAEMVELRARNEDLATRDAKAEQDRFLMQFDEAVKGLGKKYQGLLGKGDSLGLSQGAERENRLALYQDAQMYREDAKRAGRMIPSTTALVKRSVNSVFAEETKKLDRKEISDSVVKRKGQIISSPSARKTERVVVNHEEEAHRKARIFAKERDVSYG